MKIKRKRTTKEHFFYRNNQIQKLTNYWVFVGLIFLFIHGSYYYHSKGIVIVTLLFLIRLMYTQQVLLIKACLIAMIVASVFLWRQNTVEQKINETVHSQIVLLEPNQLRVVGNSLSFVGKDSIADQKKRYYYQLQTKEEKHFFEKTSKLLQLKVNATERLPQTKRNIGGSDFQAYLKSQSIYQQVKIERLDQITEMPSSNVVTEIKLLRRRLSLRVSEYYDEKTAMYVNSLMLGIKDTTFQSEKEVFESLGMLYLFSLSGMHVIFFIEGYRFVLKKLGVTLETIRWLEYVVLFFLFIFLGESISIFRAVSVVAIRNISKQFSIPSSQLDEWSWSIILGCFYGPQMVLGVSGQLSYGMAFCLIYVNEAIKNFSQKEKTLYFAFLMSLCALPLMCFYFYEWTPWVVLGSIYLIPFIQKYLMSFLFFLLLSASSPWSLLCGKIVQPFFSIFHQLLVALAHFSTFKLSLGQVSIMVLLILYGLIFQILVNITRKKIVMKCLISLMLLLGSQKFFQKGIVAFVDVGQGDSIVIQEPFFGKVVVIDVGGKLVFETKEWAIKEYETADVTYSLLPFLKSRGIQTIDVLFCTHADEDHVGDLLALEEKINITEIIVGKSHHQEATFFQKLAMLEKKGVKVTETLAPQKIKIGRLEWELLYPFQEGESGNNDSLVLTTNINNQRFLFTGDIEKEGEEKLLTRYPQLDVDILKVGHHGSQTSTSVPFLKGISPNIAIISCGINNQFNHPHQEVIHNLIEQEVIIYQTNQVGMVYFEWPVFSEDLSLKTMVEYKD